MSSSSSAKTSCGRIPVPDTTSWRPDDHQCQRICIRGALLATARAAAFDMLDASTVGIVVDVPPAEHGDTAWRSRVFSKYGWYRKLTAGRPSRRSVWLQVHQHGPVAARPLDRRINVHVRGEFGCRTDGLKGLHALVIGMDGAGDPVVLPFAFQQHAHPAPTQRIGLGQRFGRGR